MTALYASGLEKAFGPHPVLRGIDLTVASGDVMAILGASGSGKTTLLRLLAGFEQPDSGIIRIGNRVMADQRDMVPAEQRQIGYVAQEGALFPHLSVADNIVFGLPRRQRRAQFRVRELLDLVGLPAGYGARAPHQLSGGEQQRVALARALAPGPGMVLLDEPFSSLDAALRVETRQAVTDALAATGATAILVTHDQAEALSMARTVAVLRDGRLVQVATPETLYRSPFDADLARFVGDAVLLPGAAAGGWVQCDAGRLPLAAGAAQGPVIVLIRPEQIRLTTPEIPGMPRATVTDMTFYGPDARVGLILDRARPAGGGIAITARVAGHNTPVVGMRLGIMVEGTVTAFAVPASISEALALD
ncbi:MAG: ABC transporter ATP-binding protein [Azospirillaceae bacterium]|nr:ABC transporter ATP-binding protein [Azospirillaceae bacterium]